MGNLPFSASASTGLSEFFFFFDRLRYNQVVHSIDCDQIINTEQYKDGLASFFYRLRYNQETNQVLQAKC